MDHLTKKLKVLLVAERKDELFEWLSLMLREAFIVEEFYMHSSIFNPPFFLKRYYSIVKNFRRLAKVFKPDKILIYGKALTTIWIFIFLIRFFKLKIEIILFRYDIEYFRPYPNGLKIKIGHFITKRLEKFCLIKSDKIIHKGLENELEFLKFYNKIEDKPHYLFREFINSRLIRNYNPYLKLSKKDGEFHLVSVGAIPSESVPHSDSIWEFYPKITNQKLHLHLYMNVDKSTERKFKKIESQNAHFHYEGYLSKKKLINELAKYDYGLYLSNWNREGENNNLFVTGAMGYRIFDYISAHLPIICSDENVAVTNLINRYGIGIYVPQREIFLLGTKLEKDKITYLKRIRNINKAIDSLSSHRNFFKFIYS